MEKDLNQLDREQQEAREKLRQLQNREKVLLNRKRDQERRARTHRLIERGAMLESVFPEVREMDNENLKRFLIQMADSSNARKYLQETRRLTNGG